MWQAFLFFFFNDTATTEIYTLSLHDALPISVDEWCERLQKAGIPYEKLATTEEVLEDPQCWENGYLHRHTFESGNEGRSEEHTSELQSRQYLVCRLLLEIKKSATEPLAVCSR